MFQPTKSGLRHRQLAATTPGEQYNPFGAWVVIDQQGRAGQAGRAPRGRRAAFFRCAMSGDTEAMTAVEQALADVLDELRLRTLTTHAFTVHPFTDQPTRTWQGIAVGGERAIVELFDRINLDGGFKVGSADLAWVQVRTFYRDPDVEVYAPPLRRRFKRAIRQAGDP